MTLTIQTINVPAGFFSYLKVKDHTEEIAGVPSQKGTMGEPTTITSNPRATFGMTEEDSLRLLRKNITSEIKRMEKRGDLRPSQVRRLDLLKMGLGMV